MQDAARAVAGLNLVHALHAQGALVGGGIGVALNAYGNAVLDIHETRASLDAAMAGVLVHLLLGCALGLVSMSFLERPAQGRPESRCDAADRRRLHKAPSCDVGRVQHASSPFLNA